MKGRSGFGANADPNRRILYITWWRLHDGEPKALTLITSRFLKLPMRRVAYATYRFDAEIDVWQASMTVRMPIVGWLKNGPGDRMRMYFDCGLVTLQVESAFRPYAGRGCSSCAPLDCLWFLFFPQADFTLPSPVCTRISTQTCMLGHQT